MYYNIRRAIYVSARAKIWIAAVIAAKGGRNGKEEILDGGIGNSAGIWDDGCWM